MVYIMKIIFGLIGFAFVSIIFHSMIYGPQPGDKTDCFDRFSNKIDGQTCTVEDDGLGTGHTKVIVVTIFSVILLGFFIAIGGVLDSLEDLSRWGF